MFRGDILTKKILLVDDDSGKREMARSFLSSEGYEVFEAVDGADGVQKAIELQPELVILDFMMPVLNGLETLEALRLKQVRTKVLMLSVVTRVDVIVNAIKERACDYMTVPYEADELVAKVKRVITLGHYLTDPLPNHGAPLNTHVLPDGKERLAEIGKWRNELEPMLRKFIKQIFKAHMGVPGWIIPILDSIPAERRVKLAGVAAEEILEKHLFLSDLIMVIQKYWAKYFKQLEAAPPAERITQSQFTIVLDFVNTNRADAHAKDIEDMEFLTLAIAFRLLTRAIKRHVD